MIYLRSKTFLFVFLGLLLILFSAFFVVKLNTQTIKEEAPNYSSDAYWTRQIQQLGPEEAYSQLKQVISGWNYSIAHQTLHIFGFALYEQLSEGAMQYCDDYQSYGCFHGLVAGYVSEHGLSELDQTISLLCNLNPNFTKERCLHGIGHGLVDYLGTNNLNQAFEYCQKIGSQTYIGCPQGVLMEYFYPIHTQAENLAHPEFNPDLPLGPCPNLNQAYQEYCFTFVPVFYWGSGVINNPLQAEKYCNLAEDHRAFCLVGTGARLSSYFNFDVEQARGKCSEMAEFEDKVYCSIGIFWNGGPNKPETKKLYDFCNQLEEKAACGEITKKITH